MTGGITPGFFPQNRVLCLGNRQKNRKTREGRDEESGECQPVLEVKEEGSGRVGTPEPTSTGVWEFTDWKIRSAIHTRGVSERRDSS